MRERQSSNAQPPSTQARHAPLPLSDSSLMRHWPSKCSIHNASSPHSPLLQYSMRPSCPVCSVGEYSPLMKECTPSTPLMKMWAAFELSLTIASTSAAAFACAMRQRRNKTALHKTRKKGTWQGGDGGGGRRLQLGRGRKLAGAQAAASDLPLRFRSRHKLHTGCVMKRFSIGLLPHA